MKLTYPLLPLHLHLHHLQSDSLLSPMVQGVTPNPNWTPGQRVVARRRRISRLLLLESGSEVSLLPLRGEVRVILFMLCYVANIDLFLESKKPRRNTAKVSDPVDDNGFLKDIIVQLITDDTPPRKQKTSDIEHFFGPPIGKEPRRACKISTCRYVSII